MFSWEDSLLFLNHCREYKTRTVLLLFSLFLSDALKTGLLAETVEYILAIVAIKPSIQQIVSVLSLFNSRDL